MNKSNRVSRLCSHRWISIKHKTLTLNTRTQRNDGASNSANTSKETLFRMGGRRDPPCRSQYFFFLHCMWRREHATAEKYIDLYRYANYRFLQDEHGAKTRAPIRRGSGLSSLTAIHSQEKINVERIKELKRSRTVFDRRLN